MTEVFRKSQDSNIVIRISNISCSGNKIINENKDIHDRINGEEWVNTVGTNTDLNERNDAQYCVKQNILYLE